VNENSVSETKNLIKNGISNIPNEESKHDNSKNNLRPMSKENIFKDLKKTEDVEQLNDVNDEKNSSRRLNGGPEEKVVALKSSKLNSISKRISDDP